MNSPLKVITVKGNIKTGVKFKKLIPLGYADVKVGNWQIALKDLSYKFLNKTDGEFTVIDVCCNLVTGQEFDELGILRNCLIPLQRTDIKTEGVRFISFSNLLWFNVNQKSDILEIVLDICSSEEGHCPSQGDFTFTALLRRIN